MGKLEKAKEVLSYNPETGDFLRKPTYRGFKEGEKAGTKDKDDYVKIKFYGYVERGHRLAWGFYYGEMLPSSIKIDHINGDKSDNRIINLRIANDHENARNKKTMKNNKLGIKGVDIVRGKFRAQISFNRKKKHLGYFDTIEKAASAYREASIRFHGEFSCTERGNING